MLDTWATQVEVVVAASAFEIPVYFYAKKPGSEYFVWNILQMPTHFELFYYDSLHYDAIVSEGTGMVCVDVPELSDNHSELIQL